jgi:O-antigen/teichoic acid export membrane protein
VTMLKNDKDLFILTAGRALQVLFIFINFKLLTAFLSPTEVGAYFLMLAIVSYFGLVLINPIGTYVNRMIYEWLGHKQLTANLVFFLIYAFLCHVLIYPFFYFLSPWINIESQSVLNITFFATFYSLAASIGNTFVPTLNILNYRLSFVVLTNLIHILGIILSVFLVLFYNSTAQFWLLGLGISYLFFGFISLFLINKFTSGAFNQKELKMAYTRLNFPIILSFAVPIFFTNIFLWLLTQSYRPITEFFTNLEFLGFAGFGLGLASTLSVTAEYVLQQLFFPNYFKNISSKNKVERESAWNLYANSTIPIYFSLAVYISIISPFLIRLIANTNYQPAVYFLAIGIWAECIRATNNILSIIGQSEMQTRKSIFPYLIGGISCVIFLYAIGYLNYFESMLPYTLLLSQIIVCISLYYRFSKEFKIDLNYPLILKKISINITFALSLLFLTYSDNLLCSILVISISGILFSWLQFNGLKKL